MTDGKNIKINYSLSTVASGFAFCHQSSGNCHLYIIITIKAAKGLKINSTFAQILRIYDDI
jgi:hypothetical protein